MVNIIAAISLIMIMGCWLFLQLSYYGREWKDVKNEAGAILSLAIVGWLLFFWFGT